METLRITTSEDKFDPCSPSYSPPIILRSSSLESDDSIQCIESIRDWGFVNKHNEGMQKYTVWKTLDSTQLSNIKDELRATKEEMQKLKDKHWIEIREITGSTETADLFTALNAEVRAAKKKADGLEEDNKKLTLQLARMEQADAKKSFDYESSHAIPMKGGNVTNMELNNLTCTITELRGTVLKLTKDVAERDLKLQETWHGRTKSRTINGYQSMTVDELRETLKLKERLVAELRTMKSEYHQEIKDMRKKIEILESDLSRRGRIGDKIIERIGSKSIEKRTLVSLSQKNDALEKMLEGFVRTLKSIRHGDSFDMTVGGAFHRTKTSLELCSHISVDTKQLKDMVSQLTKQTNDIGIFITRLREKSVTCKETIEYGSELLKTLDRLVDFLDSHVIDDNSLVKDLREQLSWIPRPLRLVLVTLRNRSLDNMIDYDMALDSQDVQHLKAEMKMMHVKLVNLRSENVGLRKEVSLLESSCKSSRDSVGYRLALLRQQYKDRIVELELSIEEILKQSEDELSQAYLWVRQLQNANKNERADRTEELDTICALTEKLGTKLREKDEELCITKTEYERRILVLMKNYEERIAELEILNDELSGEVDALNDDLDFFRPKSDDDTKFSPVPKLRTSEMKTQNQRLSNQLSTLQDGKIMLQHKYNFVTEEAKNKIKYLQNEIKITEERCKDQDTLIIELRKRLKCQESEIGMQSQIGMKMSEKMIDRLQKRLVEQDRKLEQTCSSEALLSDGEKRMFDAEIAALHKDLRIKEMEIEEITADSKNATERHKKEISRLIRGKCTYSELCESLRKDLAAERNRPEPASMKDRQRRSRVDSKRKKDLIQKLTIKANTAEETIKNLRKRILTLTMNQESEFDSILQRLKDQRENHEKAMNLVRENYWTQIGDLITNHEDRVVSMRSSYEEKLRITTEIGKSKVEQWLTMLRAQHAAYVKTLRADHKCSITKILTRFEKQLKERDRIIGDHDRSLLATLTKFEEIAVDCNELESDNQWALDSLRDQIVRIETDFSEEVGKNTDNERRMRELEGALVKLKRQFQSSEDRLKKTITMLEEQNDALKQEHEEDLVAIKLEKQASQKKKAAIIKRMRPRRSNVTLILSLEHDQYLMV